ncbi:uncharacterized protein LOC112462105 isoform X2 [Temnothorax curvispinosus]|uniref:Uncharacterized protein LOC112462105 isoform X2 n=1 Tax=Temnothorax curvispinosus TaxID=300111 RepID=A0A6J1QLZ2_9HYME|nr:uncharacterized protein LOC112462105 isoform X2 [Temnothorax curvispinosus]
MEAIEDELLEAIQKCYTDLEYDTINLPDGDGEDTDIADKIWKSYSAETKIFTLGKKMNLADRNNFSDRFLKTASVMEKNLSLFKADVEFTDIITTIIKYLNYFGMKFMLHHSKYDEEYEKDDIVLLVLFTILKMCDEYSEILCHFIINAIITKSALEKSIQYQHLKQTYNRDTQTVIILADSDLYAFITYYKYVGMSISRIWVQDPIKEKFLWLMNNIGGIGNIQDIWDICTFRTKEELYIACWTAWTADEMNIISIWTEDIAFAKNLAMSLYGDVIFINTYMDFYNGIVLLPFTKIFGKTVHKLCKPDFDDSMKKMSVVKSSVNNLFYDGMWQLPVKGTYWIHDDRQWANATSDDVNKCINSAEKGFKIWSSKSVACRTQILSKFTSVLEGSGESVLADVVSKEIKFSCVYANSLFYVSQSEGLDVTKIRNPRGVIILKEENEAILFSRLMQILIVGNSVIVICDANSCSLVPYCNMFQISEIPPGVINLLSRKDVKELELLCGMDYESYEKQFFSEDDLEKTYINLSKPKHIVVPFK